MNFRCKRSVLPAAVLLGLLGMYGTAQAGPGSVDSPSAADSGQSSQATAAQSGQQSGQASEKPTQLQAVTVIGSRRTAPRSALKSMVPVDVIPMQESATQGASFDLSQTLKYKIPSFVSSRSSGTDNNDSIDSIALRGLDSDQTLVLINGKRMHKTAEVRLFGARGVGSVATDLNTIPVMAIGDVQVLRDGAAAQYGSDAIAGVVDIVLKSTHGCEAIAGYGQYGVGDGMNYITSAYCGFAVGHGGTISITGEFQHRGRSDRTDASQPLRIIGDARVINKTFYVNGDIPLTDDVDFYFDGGMQNRDASSAAWARQGLGSSDIPSRNSAVMYPDGFIPFIEPFIQDRHGTVGIRWQANGWHYDLSQTAGSNVLTDTIRHTLNASTANLNLMMGKPATSPTSFNAGSLEFNEQTTNFDVTKYFDGWLSGVNVAYGAAFRRDNYKIEPGVPGSYMDFDGPGGGSAGSQGFPGFQPSDKTDKSRRNWSLYLDVETDWTDRFRTDQAVRHEHYSDFGSTTIGKLSAAFDVTDAFMLRASASTGFRAPALQQQYFSSTVTGFNAANTKAGKAGLVQVVISPNGSALSTQAGIPDLTDEQSRSYTFGFTWAPTYNFSATFDAYRIDIDDRIILSDRIPDTDPRIGAILQADDVSDAQFFFNAADTRTQGFDLRLNYGVDVGQGHLTSFLTYNHNTTTIRSLNVSGPLQGRENVVFGHSGRQTLKGGAPRNKAILGLDYRIGKWDTAVNGIFFGTQRIGGTAVIDQVYNAKASADVSVTYNFTPKTKFTVGGQNVFNTYPEVQNPNVTSGGFKYESVQFGLDGYAWFVRLAHKF